MAVKASLGPTEEVGMFSYMHVSSMDIFMIRLLGREMKPCSGSEYHSTGDSSKQLAEGTLFVSEYIP